LFSVQPDAVVVVVMVVASAVDNVDVVEDWEVTFSVTKHQ
jgi:hypothetical protein